MKATALQAEAGGTGNVFFLTDPTMYSTGSMLVCFSTKESGGLTSDNWAPLAEVSIQIVSCSSD